MDHESYSGPRMRSWFNRSRGISIWLMCMLVVLALAPPGWGESCQSAGDMDAATRNALTAAGTRYFNYIAAGDTASLKQNSAASLSADFSAIENMVKSNQAALTGAKAEARPPFLLEVDGTSPVAHAEFFCGVFGKTGQTRDSAAFYLDNLAPGKYGVVILDAESAKGAHTVSLVLEQHGADWVVGGLYIKAGAVDGHDSSWFMARAREYQGKGQLHNAWLYFLMARSLISPLPFMSTAETDKLYDESQKLQPADFPGDGKTADLAAGGATYKLTAIFPEEVGSDLDLIVKYQAADVSNTNQSYQSNVAVMKALLAKYPEMRDAFVAVVARAVAPNGQDYGTLLAMKDIK